MVEFVNQLRASRKGEFVPGTREICAKEHRAKRVDGRATARATFTVRKSALSYRQGFSRIGRSSREQRCSLSL